MKKALAERMIGQRVEHITMGDGTVTFCTNIAIKIKLDESGEECAFAFPYSFKRFLTVPDAEMQKEIIDFYDTGAWVAPIHDHNEN